jgi:hypothetical protein
MTVDRKDLFDSDAGRDLVDELAQLMLQRVAPDELTLYEETSVEFFRDPQALLKARPREEAVGFGLEVALVTPSVLAVAAEVARFLATVLADSARDELHDQLKPVIARRVKRLLGQDSQPDAADRDPAAMRSTPAPGLTAEQLHEVRSIALERARQSGMDDSQAILLADALAGALLADR